MPGRGSRRGALAFSYDDERSHHRRLERVEVSTELKWGLNGASSEGGKDGSRGGGSFRARAKGHHRSSGEIFSEGTRETEAETNLTRRAVE